MGKLLEINLTTEKSTEIHLDNSLYKKYLGGKGLGAYLLFKYMKPGTEPLSEDAPLIFLTGPLTGTGFPTSGRMVVVGKSPLTKTYADSHAGGHFSYEMKRSGFDGIVIIGKSNVGKYIWINDSEVQFRDADDVWGMTTSDAVVALRGKTHENARVATIGPAGENLSLISSIMLDKDTDKTRAGIAGRTGLGAVMGSKKLKAVVVKGSGSLAMDDKSLFEKGRDNVRETVKNTEFMKVRFQYGSANLVGPMNKEGFLPSFNFQQGFIDNGEDLYCESMNKHKKRNATCYGCPINCGQIIETPSKNEVKIEYESVALLGSNNGMRSFADVSEACYICNELGLDTMSAGVVVGFAMECKENGILEDVPSFGDSGGQLKLLEDLAYRRNSGVLLTDGVKRAASRIGKGSEKYAIHVKGLEMAGYEPRTSWGMALAYATSDRGACHQRCWTVNAERSGALKMFDFGDKASFVAEGQDERAAAFSALVCDFLPYSVDDLCTAYEGITGLDFKVDDYHRAGRRIWNLIRLFNLREGFRRKDDTLPDRMFEDKVKLPEGAYHVNEIKLEKETFEKALDEYYAHRSWDKEGIPSLEILRELEISDYVEGENPCTYLKQLYQVKDL